MKSEQFVQRLKALSEKHGIEMPSEKFINDFWMCYIAIDELSAEDLKKANQRQRRY